MPIPANWDILVMVAPFSLIKLLGERIATVRSEDALNDRLFTVKELRRLREQFDRKKLSKANIGLAVKKMLRRD